MLQEHGASFDTMSFSDVNIKASFRSKVESLINTDFTFAKVKVLNHAGMVLYDHRDISMEGTMYDGIEGEGFQTALAGGAFSKLEEDDGKKMMEVYLPTRGANASHIEGVLEIYEDVTRFEAMVFDALKQALVVPTLIFMTFNILLLLLVLKADEVITANTNLIHNVRKQMQKYLSRSATEAIYSAVTTEKELFRGELQDVVIFFSDIRGFTRYSEHEKPAVVVENLNKLFELQANIIHQYHGVIDKFVGDEVMAMFAKDKVEEAVKAGLEIQQAVAQRNDIHFEIGIGIHCGEALLGSIGTEERRDYTVIGNMVNTGARFCGAALGGSVIISEVVFAQLSDETQVMFALNKPLELKGKNEFMVTYASRVG